MKFGETTVGYDDSSRREYKNNTNTNPDFFTFRTTVLEYAVEASRLRQEDRIIQYAGQNYSVTGEKAPCLYQYR